MRQESLVLGETAQGLNVSLLQWPHPSLKGLSPPIAMVSRDVQSLASCACRSAAPELVLVELTAPALLLEVLFAVNGAPVTAHVLFSVMR